MEAASKPPIYLVNEACVVQNPWRSSDLVSDAAKALLAVLQEHGLEEAADSLPQSGPIPTCRETRATDALASRLTAHSQLEERLLCAQTRAAWLSAQRQLAVDLVQPSVADGRRLRLMEPWSDALRQAAQRSDALHRQLTCAQAGNGLLRLEPEHQTAFVQLVQDMAAAVSHADELLEVAACPVSVPASVADRKHAAALSQVQAHLGSCHQDLEQASVIVAAGSDGL